MNEDMQKHEIGNTGHILFGFLFFFQKFGVPKKRPPLPPRKKKNKNKKKGKKKQKKKKIF